MPISIAQIILWILLGAIAGAIVSAIRNRRRSLGSNIILGLIGALVGGFLFSVFNINIQPEILSINILGGTITFTDLVAAVVGAFIVLGILAIVRRA